MEHLLLGLDGGGTKTVALICNTEGFLLGRGIAGSSNIKSEGIVLSEKAIIKAIQEALDSAKINLHGKTISACFGMAGCNTPEDKKAYERLIDRKIHKKFNLTRCLVVNDSQIAFAAGTEKKWGVVLIAGTGSICLGLTECGKTARCGGYDWLISDEGSAFEIGRKALQATLKVYEKRGPVTLISNLIFSETKSKTINDLVNWVYQGTFSKSKIAMLSVVVDKAYQAGDEAAVAIVNETLESLTEMAGAVISELDLSKSEFDFVFSGGVFKLGNSFIEKFIQKIKHAAPRANLIQLIREPVWGAIKLAKEGDVL